MMNEYHVQQSSETPASAFILAGMVATQFLNPCGLPEHVTGEKLGIVPSSYTLNHSSSTASQQSYLIGDYSIGEADRDFVETVSSFYASLSSKQEPLGRDFEKVLNENLWDLYGS